MATKQITEICKAELIHTLRLEKKLENICRIIFLAVSSKRVGELPVH